MLPREEPARRPEAKPAPAPAHGKHSVAVAAAAAEAAVRDGLAAGRKPDTHAPGSVARLGS